MTHDISSWVTGYRRAWESNSPDDIRALFSEDAEYRTDPWLQPWRGHDEIVEQWRERADDPGSTTFTWSPLVETDDLSVVQGETAYKDGRTYSNLWVVKFDEDGRAKEFTEWWMDKSRPS